MLQIIFFRIRYYSYSIQYPLSRQQISNDKKYTISYRVQITGHFSIKAPHNLIIILTAKSSGDTGICSWFMAFSNFSSRPGNETSCDHHRPKIRLRFSLSPVWLGTTKVDTAVKATCIQTGHIYFYFFSLQFSNDSWLLSVQHAKSSTLNIYPYLITK